MLFLDHDVNAKRLVWSDSHAYSDNQNDWYPGVTTILGIVDKGDNFHEFLKNNGHNADYIVIKAMENGSLLHSAIEKFNSNPDNPVNYVVYDANGVKTELYNQKVWSMFSHYVDFYTRFKPRLLAVEQILCSPQRGYGGQVDLVAYLKYKPTLVKDKWLIMPCDEEILWLIDHKSGNIYQESELQTSAYAMMWNDAFPEYKIQATGILELDALTRTEGKVGTVQGSGWALRLNGEETEYNRLYKIFEGVHNTWHWKHQAWRPFFASYPSYYCRSEIDKTISE